MKNILIFSKRNAKEILRDPLSILFNVIFPVLMLFVFQLIISSMTKEEIARGTPQFLIERLAPGLCMFSFSFLMLFTGMLVARDRQTSFLNRIKSSPLKVKDFIFGYALPMIPLGLVQIILCYSLSFIFGLKLTGGLLLSIIISLPIMLFYIFLGILLGALLTDKTVGGIASAVISFGSIFGGIFMPLDLMEGSAIYKIAYALPFANSLKAIDCAINLSFSSFGLPFIITISYSIVTIIVSVIIFKKTTKNL